MVVLGWPMWIIYACTRTICTNRGTTWLPHKILAGALILLLLLRCLCRILGLKNFVMGYSSVDNVLRPPETGWFAHFSKNTESKLTLLEDQAMYKEDWIGLRTLAESGRLHRFVSPCPHADYNSNSCFVPTFLKNAMPFLKIPFDQPVATQN